MYYENFQKLCEQAGVTPGEVSRHTGVASSTLTMWKQGAYTPKADKLKRIADYFGVTLEYLQTGVEGENDHFITEDVSRIARSISDNQDLMDMFGIAVELSKPDIEMATGLMKRLLSYNSQIKNLPRTEEA